MVQRVVNEPSRPIRARNADEKQRRREDILKAAEHLWQTTPYSELSMNQVAREARLAKGTLYLYFDTKEELFLALLSNHLQDWFAILLAELRQQTPQTLEQVADVLVASSVNQEPLRRLLLLLSTVLERNVRSESWQAFRRLVRLQMRETVNLLPYPPELTFRIFTHLYALSVGWHQATEAKSAREEEQLLLAEYPCPNFDVEFGVALRAVLSTLVAQQQG